MTSRVVVLGGCGGWPEPGRACSGFLVEHVGYRLVLDLGYGTLPRLLALLQSTVATGLDAVVVTHDHPDHLVDLHGLLRARLYDGRGEPPIELVAPAAVRERVAGLEDLLPDELDGVLRWTPLPASPSRLGPFVMTCHRLPHYVPDFGVRLTAPGLTLAYTGDTGPDPALADLGRDADLFIVDATDRHQQGQAAGDDMNLTARAAGRAAAEAGARRLMLTHFWPGNDRERSRREAAERFAGPILLADEGTEVQLAGPGGS